MFRRASIGLSLIAACTSPAPASARHDAGRESEAEAESDASESESGADAEVVQGCLGLGDGDSCADGDPCTEHDACAGGRCVGLPKACDAAPGPVCVGNTRRTFTGPGECHGGRCVYPSSDETCPDACDAGECVASCVGPGMECPRGAGCCDGLTCWWFACIYQFVCTRDCTARSGGSCEPDFGGACCKRPGPQTDTHVCYPSRYGVCEPGCGCAEGCN